MRIINPCVVPYSNSGRRLSDYSYGTTTEFKRQIGASAMKRALYLEQRLAQVGRKLSAEGATSLIAEDFVEFAASGKVRQGLVQTEIIAAMSLLGN